MADVVLRHRDILPAAMLSGVPGDGYDLVVVGGGAAGCAFAARHGGRVLVLEAGSAEHAPEVLDAASLAAAEAGHPANWAYPAELRPGHVAAVPRGRVLGGSSAINGASWVRAVPADGDGWGAGWSYADLLPHYVRSENDRDFGDRPGHGDRGPVPVRRPAGALLHPAAERFLAAADVVGFPREPDKNASGPPGAGLMPSNADGGVRVNAALAYLAPPPPGVTVRGHAPVARVLLDDDRAVGVELGDGTRVEAGEVVLAAGAIGTPLLLLRSGIGPADELRAAGIPVVLDAPGVGRGFSDHPAVFLPFAADDPPAHPHAASAQAALDLDAGADPAGDCEVLLFVRPLVPGGPLLLMCALQHADSRGEITLTPDGPRIAYRYLRTEHDRRRLRHAVRTAAELLRAGLGVRIEPGGDVLGTDRALDGWIAARLTTSQHLCGSAAIGTVVDADLRVLGIAGLSIVDTSVLPVAPRRGPAATAVAIGEKAGSAV